MTNELAAWEAARDAVEIPHEVDETGQCAPWCAACAEMRRIIKSTEAEPASSYEEMRRRLDRAEEEGDLDALGNIVRDLINEAEATHVQLEQIRATLARRRPVYPPTSGGGA